MNSCDVVPVYPTEAERACAKVFVEAKPANATRLFAAACVRRASYKVVSEEPVAIPGAATAPAPSSSVNKAIAVMKSDFATVPSAPLVAAADAAVINNVASTAEAVRAQVI